ncbi:MULTISPECIES: maleylpyruvate isomerase family mycothiol-dependent enzyme [Mycobacterium]|uniref:Mycothiol-dependent maleylpyruvate isomerase metal-binding domain-containing protein n=1 Tax=Mycobacterium kiyosense TaxID=2871094 RepID=A0A9P3UZZ9_9MYCO|nr:MULTISPECIES: maleylpyruvate isomerase family mycothiol-dependent enzyme [Mycobacterium]BDB43673.1 hypothetical protein IWGMT90018_41190 [Mycobacterium kiyosense]BDE15233.1 hypothetical protein MKCMC460_40930 [Mycobacterium sp. 20KCMC460]GLB83478.1 hypothetical protein SRL2020028_27340 [Mycobacterium kiyosense]GLB91705.1 hypothetical protein SRL2020130_45220 [Mycobacterium kiyosense]GLB94295.1 hypothetical protein SRL2020226_10710 [Mycobacterium kiyosense]
MHEAAEFHLAVCRRFGAAVAAAAGRWERPSPCDAWTARGVLEHVIGFHDVLVLRPLSRKPDRPRDDPQARWLLTYDALTLAFSNGAGPEPPTLRQAFEVIPKLTRDVLIHTWDLARAVGADDRLDPGWCELSYAQTAADWQDLSASGMFGRPVCVPDDADVQTKLLAQLGRDPLWR